MRRETAAKPHSVYRLFSEDVLLYVGATHDIARRYRQHQRKAPWIGEVTRVDVQVFPDRRAALEAEAAAIRSECPKYNVVHQDTGHGYHRYASSTDPCRCPVCRQGKADYMRERRAHARKVAQAGIKVIGILHGSRAGYEEHGCRCALCMRTRSVYGHDGRLQAERPRRIYRRAAAS